MEMWNLDRVKNGSTRSRRRLWLWGGSLALVLAGESAWANPVGGVVSQGSATIGTAGSQVTINQSTATAFINWQSFNQVPGETITFNQPSASSVTWNYIYDPSAPSASAINGTINANGYVILQNPNGITVGGSALLNTHGLVMTTASTPGLDLAGGGAWSFAAPPPTAKVINYGQINISGGGSVYLIASDIENHGTISAPNGKIGLYAGQQVLVSMSPDGRGLSAQVTLPTGSVNNQGQLIADAGSIAAQAQVVNQSGVVQANSVQNVNGVIELVASQNVALGAGSQINANGDATAVSASPGGFVVVNAGNGSGTFADATGSAISVAGAAGGPDGFVEIFGKGTTANTVKSVVGGVAASQYSHLLVNPVDVTISSDPTDTSSTSPTFNVNDLSAYSQIDVQAMHDINLSPAYGDTLIWSLPDSTMPNSALNLAAGHDINFNADPGTGQGALLAGNNWDVNLTAGNGIYLWGATSLQAQNGNLNLFAGNEVQVGWNGSGTPAVANSGGAAITTKAGGNITVTTHTGDVNTGGSTYGFDYLNAAPYYTPDTQLGGISTAAGGNVTINAGGDVISFPTTTVAASDAGSGAFGAQPGNVTINAGGSVFGHFVLVNGVGTINAGQDLGNSANNIALSLVAGSWNLNAAGDIYLQEVRNPNGVFDNQFVNRYNPVTHKFTSTPTAGNHLFNYDPLASVSLTAGNGVHLTGYNLPRPNGTVPLLLPPILWINAGAGGVTLQTPNFVDANSQNISWTGNQSEDSLTLFPSAYQNLHIVTADGGGLTSGNPAGNPASLLMSDSGVQQWFAVPAGYTGAALFGPLDHASAPAQLGNVNPVLLNISGNMDNIILQVSRLAQITVGGDMTGCSFYGANLNAGDVTSIQVNGALDYKSSFTSITLNQAFPDLLQLSQSLPAGYSYLPLNTVDNWFTILQMALVDPAQINNQSFGSIPLKDLSASLHQSYSMFPGLNVAGLEYNPASLKLTTAGPLAADLYTALTSPYLYLVRYGPNGYPVLDNSGHFVIDKVAWVPGGSANALAILNNLYTPSQSAPPLVGTGALIVGGTGEFDVTAGAINLGNSEGILTVGAGGTFANPILGQVSYAFLKPYISSGASIVVDAGYLQMPSSTIAALSSGDVKVTTTGIIPNSLLNSQGIGVSMDLGSPDLVDFEAQIMAASNLGLGIYTTGGGKLNVTANGTINIDTSRIATFNGGSITIESLHGDVNAGSGGAISIPINVFPLNVSLPAPYEYAYANGIVANTLQPQSDGTLIPGAATAPGDITVVTPQGSIYASLGGILQESLSGTLPPGPSISLEAGTPAGGDWKSTAAPLYTGDVQLGNSGVIGGAINVKATGKVSGLLISAQNATVTSQTVGALTVLAGGTANVSSQGSSGSGITIIGGQGVNASGVGSGATVLGQNVSVNGGSAQSTLGNSATTTSTSSSAAGQANSESQQQVASTDASEDDAQKKKKPLLRKTGRVTVILSSAAPAR